MPGYKLCSSDQKRIEPKYLCNFCGLLLKNAMQTGCGHFYCEECLGGLHVNDQCEMTSVQDQTELLEYEVFPDMLIRREINTLEVHCTFVDDGCIWRGEVKNLEQHQEVNCKAYPVSCDKCSKEGIPRGKLTDHQSPILGDCRGIQGPCPFSQIGCSNCEVLSPEEKKEHLLKENVHHNVLLLEFAVRVNTEMESVLRSDPTLLISRQQELFNPMQIHTDTERYLQEERLRQLSERITALERELVLLKTSGGASGASSQRLPDDEGSSVPVDIERRVTYQEALILENNRIAMESCREAENPGRQLDNGQDTPCRSEPRLDNPVALRNVTFADLEEYVKEQEAVRYDGRYTWRIPEFARKRREAVDGRKVSFCSPFFYSSHDGYKMCVRIYLNGDGTGRGTHISLFLVVLPGNFDAILRWPFRPRVTFTLMDQDRAEDVIGYFQSPFEDPRRGTNIANIGCPTFFSIEELNNHAYVRDDTMFIKIFVDTSKP
ncbi:PREDICTED: TNF receptor-associated factor 2-like [Acropora digitifera]|uniref:TNF receptor-associated factor 2-like n=1 Tax=Acropora digitifera TaxID=70779 RepID=UPI00077A030F|nr:PREDICTED: TNF receptor-associated factor 2-like [Acropora digitifera]XP_015772348.1 PREDICTED: TNF receptor-associated factor 2-like [Acropora digitifera]